MAFDGTGQGIHDADWQASFGGDAYLTNGSLGCVNTPSDISLVYSNMPTQACLLLYLNTIDEE